MEANVIATEVLHPVDYDLPLDRIASVASFFVSCIDTEVDGRLVTRLATSGHLNVNSSIH